MKIDRSSSITALAAEVPGAIGVFESFGLEFACAGSRSLEDAAYAEGADPDEVVTRLRDLNVVKQAESWNDKPLEHLVRHLVSQHHRVVREQLAHVALQLADLCSGVGSERSGDLRALRATFAKFSDDLLAHLHSEEDHVFPAIEEVEKEWQAADAREVVEHDLRHLIWRLVDEHVLMSGSLRHMRELRMGVSGQEISPRCKAALESISTLEADLHECMFLENAMLFPRALAMEEQLMPAS